MQGAEDPAIVTMPLARLRRHTSGGRQETQARTGASDDLPPTMSIMTAQSTGSMATTVQLDATGPWTAMVEEADEAPVRPLGRRVLGTVGSRPAGRQSDESLDDTASFTTSEENANRTTSPAVGTGSIENDASSIASWIMPPHPEEARTMPVGSVPLSPEQVPQRLATGMERPIELFRYPGATAKAPTGSAPLPSAQAMAGQVAAKHGTTPAPPSGTGLDAIRSRTPLPAPPQRANRRSRSQSDAGMDDAEMGEEAGAGASSSRTSTIAPPEERHAKAPRTTGYNTPKLTSWSVPKVDVATKAPARIPNYP